MLKIVIIAAAVVGVVAFAFAGTEDTPKGDPPQVSSVYDFTVKNIDGKDVPLSTYKGDVLLIVNVASKCGLTSSQYAGLEEVYGKYKDRGLRVLAFPCNDFLGQEPGSADEIKEFCRVTKKATFDLFAKIKVKGDDVAPLYHYLIKHPDEDIAGPIKWNFQKYLVDRSGKVEAVYSPRTSPTGDEMTKKIEELLAEEKG